MMAPEMAEGFPLTLSQKQNPESAGWRHSVPPPPPSVAPWLQAQDAYRCLSPAITLLIKPALLEVITEK